MSVLDWFKRKRRIRSDEGSLDLEPEEAELWPGEGTGNPLAPELARRRWMLNVEGLNTAQSGIDPASWEDGRVAFASERSMAFDHEVLRGQLRDRVAALCRDQMKALFMRAKDVAEARDYLKITEAQLVEVQPEVLAAQKAIEGHPYELSRYHHSRSTMRGLVRKGLGSAFVISEFLMTGALFKRAFLTKIVPNQEFIFALGMLVLLVAIPHYVAQGLKNGLTRYHTFDLDPQGEDDTGAPPELRRRVHFERWDDNVFRIASGMLLVILGVLAVPLSVLRIGEIGQDRWWFFVFFLCLQLGISAYFFLVEWLDYGLGASLRKAAEDRRNDLNTEWLNARAEVGKAVAAFHEHAEDLIFTIRQAPTWDDEIVASYYAGMWSGRAVMEQASPGLDRFVHQGQYPALENVGEGELGTKAADPLTREMPRLDHEDAFGRDWWMELANDALVIEDADPEEGTTPKATATWLLSKSPAEMLRWFLRTYFDMPLEYQTPEGLEPEADEAEGDAISVEGADVSGNGHAEVSGESLSDLDVTAPDPAPEPQDDGLNGEDIPVVGAGGPEST